MTALLCSLNMIVFVPESRRGLRDAESNSFTSFLLHLIALQTHVLSQLGVRRCCDKGPIVRICVISYKSVTLLKGCGEKMSSNTVNKYATTTPLLPKAPCYLKGRPENKKKLSFLKSMNDSVYR